MKKYCLDGEIASFDYHDQSGIWAFCGPKSLKAFLADLKEGEKAEIEINSPGGSVVSGCEMANAIKNSRAHLIAHVTGMAASMASVIACACDEIILEEASFMMIHDPWAELAGNAADLRKEADILDRMKDMILSFYRRKFRKSEEELASLMSAETYMTASECVDAGLDCRLVKSEVRYAAKFTARDMTKAPEAARAFFKTAPIPDDVKAAIDAATGSLAHQSAIKKQNDPVSPVDWESRYKGASKKINEYQAKIAELEKAAEVYAEKEKNLNEQLEKAGKDLADANASISDLAAKLDKSEKALGETAQQLELLSATRDLLTAGVLTPSDDLQSYEERIAAAKTPNDKIKIARDEMKRRARN